MINIEKMLCDNYHVKCDVSFRKYLDLCLSKRIYPDWTYCEDHHILPKSLYPEFDWYDKENGHHKSWNCVSLSLVDHLTAHVLFARSFNRCMNMASLMTSGKCMNIAKLSESEIAEIADLKHQLMISRNPARARVETLFEIWIENNKPKRSNFSHILKTHGYDFGIGQLNRLVGEFLLKSPRTSELEHGNLSYTKEEFDTFFDLWVANGKPKYTNFTKLLNDLGIEYKFSTRRIVDSFVNKSPVDRLGKRGEMWSYYEEIKPVWLQLNKPTHTKLRNHIIENNLFNYDGSSLKGMVDKFKAEN